MTLPFKTELEQRLIDLMKANADFNAINVFYRGNGGPLVPTEHYPFAEVYVGVVEEEEGSTGSDYYHYEGAVIFNEQYPDHPTVVDRVATVESHDRVASWAQAAVQLFRRKPTLDTFASGDGSEEVARVDVRAPAYFLLPGRPDNLDNQSIVELHVHTKRRRT